MDLILLLLLLISVGGFIFRMFISMTIKATIEKLSYIPSHMIDNEAEVFDRLYRHRKIATIVGVLSFVVAVVVHKLFIAQ